MCDLEVRRKGESRMIANKERGDPRNSRRTPSLAADRIWRFLDHTEQTRKNVNS